MRELIIGVALLILGLLAGLAKRDRRQYARVVLGILVVGGVIGAVTVIWSMALGTASVALSPFIDAAKKPAAEAALSSYAIDDRINFVLIILNLTLGAIYLLTDHSADQK